MTVNNLVELASASVLRFADRPLFGERDGRTWRWMTYAGWQDRVDRLRAGLAAQGVDPGDRVAIVSRNSAAWAAAAYASYGLGATFVPMYEAQRPDDWEFILRDAGARLVFGRTPAIAAALAAMQPRLPALRRVVSIEGPDGCPERPIDESIDGRDDDPRSLRGLVRSGRARPIGVRRVAPDEIAGLIYTSGTTGLPKGVMLTHRNLTSNVLATIAEFPIGPDDRTLSFLPWAHVYGQVCELHILIAAGASTAFNLDTDHLLDDLREVRPTILVAVPRIFNQLHVAVRSKIEHRSRAIRRVLERGLHAAIRRRRGARLGALDRIAAWLIGLVFFGIRRALGGRLRCAISGSATLSREVAELIDGVGVEVYEGYGLTETSPIVTMNRPGRRKLGSVGQPIAGVTIALDESAGDAPGEGEIVVHGPNVMAGYHARPDDNARVFTADGGLRTGDLGRIDDAGYLFITGRIKDQYKLENGKYVMPGPLEERLALSPFIRAVMLYGDGRPCNVALVAIDPASVRAWAAERGAVLGDGLTADPEVRRLIQAELDRESRAFRPYERPVDCALTEVAFSVESGLLTPTLKLKRRAVAARFGAALDALYRRPRSAGPDPRRPAPGPPGTAV